MNSPLISVLIPCYNREKYIRQCVSSVLCQSFRDIEVIVSDNASTDTTYEILKEFARHDQRVKLFRNETNLGPIPNWRCCLSRARGKYVHWMWSDDYIEPEFYSTLVRALDQSKAALALASSMLLCEPDNTLVECQLLKKFKTCSGGDVAQGLLGRVPLWPVSPAAWLLPAEHAKKHFYEQIPVFTGIDCNSTAIGADLLMIAGCATEAPQVVHCSEAIVVFRAHSGSISISRPTWRHYEVAKIWFIVSNKLERGVIHKIWLMARALRIRSLHLIAYVILRVSAQH